MSSVARGPSRSLATRSFHLQRKITRTNERNTTPTRHHPIGPPKCQPTLAKTRAQNAPGVCAPTGSFGFRRWPLARLCSHCKCNPVANLAQPLALCLARGSPTPFLQAIDQLQGGRAAGRDDEGRARTGSGQFVRHDLAPSTFAPCRAAPAGFRRFSCQFVAQFARLNNCTGRAGQGALTFTRLTRSFQHNGLIRPLAGAPNELARRN